MDGDAAPAVSSLLSSDEESVHDLPAVSSLLSSDEESVRDLRSFGDVAACRCLSRLRAAGLSTAKVSSGPLSQISNSERSLGSGGSEGATARAIDSS